MTDDWGAHIQVEQLLNQQKMVRTEEVHTLRIPSEALVNGAVKFRPHPTICKLIGQRNMTVIS